MLDLILQNGLHQKQTNAFVLAASFYYVICLLDLINIILYITRHSSFYLLHLEQGGVPRC